MNEGVMRDEDQSKRDCEWKSKRRMNKKEYIKYLLMETIFDQFV